MSKVWFITGTSPGHLPKPRLTAAIASPPRPRTTARHEVESNAAAQSPT